MKTWDLVKEVIAVDGTRLYNANTNLMQISRANGKRRPAYIKVQISNEDADKLLRPMQPYGAQAFIIVADIDVVNAILDREKAEVKTAELQETYTDENGKVWEVPTSWAYAQACKALHKHTEQERVLQEAIKCALQSDHSGISKITAYVRTVLREAIMQEAVINAMASPNTAFATLVNKFNKVL